MRMSGTITLGLLSAVMLTAGCGRSTTRTVAGGGRVFYDANRNPVPRGQWLGPDGRPKQLFDADGNPVAENEVLSAYNSTTSTSTSSTGYRRTSSVWWGPSFYSPRPTYSGPWSPSTPRPSSAPSSAGPGRTYFGGSRPGTSPAPSFGSKSGGSSFGGSSSSGSSSVSRGGFGGSSSGGSSAS